MASVQERLQLKRLPLDNWTVSEKLYLASAVASGGDQNWMSVSRSLKIICGTNRPHDWFSQKSCAAQYGKLLESVETPKRKKRNEKDANQSTVDTPIELIVRKLTQERIAVLEKCIQEEREEYAKIKEEIAAIENDQVDEQQLRDWWAEIENEEMRFEKEQQKHAQWLKEREERKREMERSWRPNALQYQQGSPAQSPSKSSQLKVKLEEMEVDDPNSRQSTSPLLTSLLKSPSAAPNPTVPSIMHNVMTVSGTQTRVAAPTITNLLTGSTTILMPQTMVKQIVGSVVSSVATPFAVQLQTQPLTGPAPSDQLINHVPQSPSQSAPTLSMLLENKNKESMSKSLMRVDSLVGRVNDAKPMPSGEQEIGAIESPIKDEDQQLMEDINGLIPDNIDELANILNENNADILNPELLEEESILENVDAFIGDDEDASDNIELDATDDAIQGETKDVEMVDVVEEKFQDSLGTVAKSGALSDVIEQPKEEQNIVDEEILDVKIEDSDEVKQDESSSHSTLAELEKVATLSKDVDDDSSSDLSNDTPLSELIKQESTAKAELQQKTAAAAAAAAAEATVKVEKEEPDIFESDSNDDKCLGRIQREIQSLSEQMKNESSENSSETPVESAPVVELDEEEEEVKNEDIVVAEPVAEVDEEEPQAIEPDKKEKEIEDDGETIQSIDLKPEDDEIVELSSNEADQVQEKDVDEEEHRGPPVTSTDVEEIEDIQPVGEEQEEEDEEEEEEKNPANETTTADIPSADIPPNFANIFPTDDSVDEVVEEAIEATETTETSEPEEKKEIDEAEQRATPPMTNEVDEIIEDKGSVESVEIVEIKDDDDKSESHIIVIEEADDLIIEESVGAMDSEKHDEIVAQEQSASKEEESVVEESAPKSEPERKLSTDDELFEDAKEQIDDVKSEDLQQSAEAEAEAEAAQQPITIIDTDDDMPMEVIKEDKVGRAKRDYSRRNKESTQSIDKRSEETTSSDDVFSTIGSRLRLKERDRSESPYVEEDSGEPPAKSKRRYSSTPNIDSLPNSPASSDDREYRGWKKSILLVYNGLIAHRYASLFSKPITEDQAPDYKTIVYQAMDLQTLKRNIDSGNIRTTLEFQRYVMLMCHNAMFYNFNDTIICARAKEMLGDALSVIEDIMDTWKKENEKSATITSTSTGSTTKVVRGRKSNRLMN